MLFVPALFAANGDFHLLKNPFPIARGLLPTPSRVHSHAAPKKPALHSPAGADVPAGLRGAPKRAHAAGEQLSPMRSQLPPPQAEIRSQSRDIGGLHRQHGAHGNQRANGLTLGELMAPDRHQEQIERAKRTQLVRTALPDGGGTMQRLTDRAIRRHPATLAEMWHAGTTGAPNPMEGHRRQEFEALVRADVMALAVNGRMHPTHAVQTMRLALADGTLGQRILPEDRQLLMEVLDHLANPIERLYQGMNLRLTPETWPAFTDAQVLEAPRPLGAGKFNSVFTVKLQEPDGSTFNGVFKPVNPKRGGWVSAVSGIPKDDPQTAMRNMATVAFAKKLGMDVIADTRLAMIDTGGGPFEPQLGMVMEHARGTPASKTPSSILARGDVSKEITKLQLLDHLTAQGDRHHNNYFIDVRPDGSVKVTGIDNDQCFGHVIHKPESIQHIPDDQQWGKGFRGTGLPPVVDTDMEASINALTERDIRYMLGDKLTEPEIQAALDRHDGLKKHIANLRTENCVIDPSEWDGMDVQYLLNGQNSYAGRDRDKATLREQQQAQAQARLQAQAQAQAQEYAKVQAEYRAQMQAAWQAQQNAAATNHNG
jgi:hypothetical protein